MIQVLGRYRILRYWDAEGIIEMDYCRMDGWGVAGLDFTVSGSRVHQEDS